jgi:transposase
MHPDVQRVTRRVHAAEFKAKVVAQCREPGASVAAVAMANGVNANLVRKWLGGRGVKRAGLSGEGLTPPVASAAEDDCAALAPALPGGRFVPVSLAAAIGGRESDAHVQPSSAAAEAAQISVEVRRGDASMTVQWPASQAPNCASWLSELAATVLGMSRP